MRYVIITAIINTKIKKYKKGTRVIINIGTKKLPEYYSGTVSRSGSKIYVTFDDGDKNNYPAKSNKLMGIGIKRKRKSEIPVKELTKYLVKDKSIVKEKKIVKRTGNKRKKPESNVSKNEDILETLGREFANGKSMAKLGRENQELFYGDTGQPNKWITDEIKRYARKFGWKSPTQKKWANLLKSGDTKAKEAFQRKMRKKAGLPG